MLGVNSNLVKRDVRNQHLCANPDCSNLTTQRCTACKKVFYCGSDCQKFDWKNHRTECRLIRFEAAGKTAITSSADPIKSETSKTDATDIFFDTFKEFCTEAFGSADTNKVLTDAVKTDLHKQIKLLSANSKI